MECNVVRKQLRDFIHFWDENAVSGYAVIKISKNFRNVVVEALNILNSTPDPEIDPMDYDWPKNLLLAAGIQIEDLLVMPDFDSGLKVALDSLAEKQKRVLELRFRDGLTLKEVGKELGVTRERICQLEEHALRKLRHPAYRRIILAGAEMLEECAKARNTLVEEVKALNAEIAKVRKNRQLLKNVLSGNISEEEKAFIGDHVVNLNVDIAEMELSMRSYNCLRRAGYRTINDLVGITMDKLVKTRNLGRKSLEEIIDKLKEWGIEVK